MKNKRKWKETQAKKKKKKMQRNEKKSKKTKYRNRKKETKPKKFKNIFEKMRISKKSQKLKNKNEKHKKIHFEKNKKSEKFLVVLHKCSTRKKNRHLADFPKEIQAVLDLASSSQTPATHRTIDAVHSWVIDEGLNLRHLPRTGNFRMFMNEVFSHFHLQLVTLYTSSGLWLNFLCSQFADFSRFCARVQQRGKLITWRTSHKTSEFCPVIFRSHSVPWALAVVKSTANPSRSPNLVPIKANLEGLSIAVVPHAFNSFESRHR